MKRILFSLLAISLLQACAPASSTQTTDAIKDFYTAYIQENSKEPGDQQKIASLKQQYCTPAYLKELSDAELDADPFLNAQDVDADWVSTLEILPDGTKKNLYSVCFLLVPDQSKHCVNVSMKQEGDQWKINDVQPQ